MSPNPFAENPFSDGPAAEPAQNPWSKAHSSSNRASASDLRMTPDLARSTPDLEALRAKEAELNRREAQLNLREARLNQKEEAIGALGPPNWPPCRPMVRHSIQEDIPEHGRNIMKRLYFGWILWSSCCLLNMVAGFAILVTDSADNNGTHFAISVALFLLGPPIAFITWYRSIYTGIQVDRSLSFVNFFVWNFLCIAACIIYSIGMPGWGGTGVIVAIDSMTENVGAGIVGLIAAGVWIFSALYLSWQYKTVLSFYRSRGMSTSKAAAEAANTETGRKVAGEVIKQSVANKV